MNFGALLLFLASGGLYFAFKKAERWRILLSSAHPRKIGEIFDNIGEMGEMLGTGSFRDFVELKGRVECERPLIAPGSRRQCVYFEVKVERVFEEDVETTDKDGRKTRRTETRREQVSGRSESTRFFINDDTGRMLVIPDEARFEGLLKTGDSFIPAENPNGEMSPPWSWLAPIIESRQGRRTVGYHCSEYMIPLDPQLSVIGECSDLDEEIVVKEGEGERPLIISRVPRKKLMKKAARKAALLLGGARAAGVGAVVLFLWSKFG